MPKKAPSHRDGHVIGIISDTHGALQPGVAKAFEKADVIIHAGDVGKPEVLKALRAIAPVVAVRGNMDGGGWARELPKTEVVEIEEVSIYVLHDVYSLDLDPATAGFEAVISGHTHRPSIEKMDGVLYLNPGSARSPRSNYPATVAIIQVNGRCLTPSIIKL